MTGQLYVSDVTLRDGSHALRRRYTLDEVRAITAALDAAGVDSIEVGHGDGLGGSSLDLGLSPRDSLEMIDAAAQTARRSAIAVLLQPGVGTISDLKDAVLAGARAVRVATHCTRADRAAEHIGAARELGLDTAGFLMMAALATPEELAVQARLMESYGAQCVYIADSSGSLTTPEITRRVRAVRDALHESTGVGVHAHENLSLGVANSVAAVEAGACRVDASLAGMGAGAGNTPIEAFCAVADRMGWEHGIDLAGLIDAAEDLVRPLQDRPVRVDRDTLTLGYAGVAGSFLAPARQASRRYGIPSFDILVEVGRRRLIGGQEDMVPDIASDALSSIGRAPPREVASPIEDPARGDRGLAVHSNN